MNTNTVTISQVDNGFIVQLRDLDDDVLSVAVATLDYVRGYSQSDLATVIETMFRHQQGPTQEQLDKLAQQELTDAILKAEHDAS